MKFCLLISVAAFISTGVAFAQTPKKTALDNPICVKAAKDAVAKDQPGSDVSDPDDVGGITAATKDRTDILTIVANVEGDYYYSYEVTLKNIEGQACAVADVSLVDSGY